MRLFAKLMIVSLFAFCPPWMAAHSALAANSAASIDRPAQQFVLFRAVASEPPTVSEQARAQLTHNPFEREILYTQWVKLNGLDHAAPAPGDRVVVEVRPGESYELVISTVNTYEGGGSWYAHFEVLTAYELPGWGLLRETKLGSGTHLDNSGDSGSPEVIEKMKQERDQQLAGSSSRVF